MRRVWHYGLLSMGGLLLWWAFVGLAQTAPPPEDVRAGKRLYRSIDWTGTGLTCLHCHADFNEKKTPDGYLRPGHSLFNSGFRAVYHAWDGRTLPSLEKAIATCMERWMTERDGEDGGKPPAKHHIRQILAYLRSETLSPEKKSKSIEPIRADRLPEDRVLKRGDPNLGAPVFRRSCVLCHHADGRGAGPPLARSGFSRYQIAKKVRGIDNPGLNGLVMPAFSKDRLSDRELINLVACVYEM